jgi:hypothetical protein
MNKDFTGKLYFRSNDRREFWQSFALGLGMALFLILAAFIISAYADPVSSPLQFRTDQYLPPQIIQPLIIQPGCQK